jgi:hypothetical protein
MLKGENAMGTTWSWSGGNGPVSGDEAAEAALNGAGVRYRVHYSADEDPSELSESHEALFSLHRELLGSAELEFDAQGRLKKIWTVSIDPVPSDRLFSLRSLPDSVRMHREFLRRYGLGRFLRAASDESGALELCFDWASDCRQDDWLERLAIETGVHGASLERRRQVLDLAAGSAQIGLAIAPGGFEIARWTAYLSDIPLLPSFAVAYAFGREGIEVSLERSRPAARHQA